MIRLTLLIPTLDRSGAEKQLTLLATRLPRDEFDVEVVLLTRGGPYLQALQGIKVTCLNKRHKVDVGVWRRLKLLIDVIQPHILHTWLFAANAYGRLAVGGRRRPKVVVSERCVDSWKSGWQLWLDRRLISRTDWLIGNSQSVVDFYREQGFPTERASVIHNGMDLPTESTIDRAALLRELQLPQDARLIGFVGRLAKQKRVEDLLWAIQLTRQADARAYLLLVGDGPERSRLEQHARDVECTRHVRFLGHREDAAALMPAFDVFWLGSDFEGLSNSVMEAMAARVPVVVSNIPPNRELVTHGVHGYLVDVGDGVGFAQYTVKLLQDSALARQLGEAGRSRIAGDFNVQKMIDAHVSLYRRLITTQQSPLTPSPI